jgi:hypothetical protein
MYKIESGAKCPEVKPHKSRKYFFEEMVVGDAFKVPIETSAHNTYKKLVTARSHHKCKPKDYPIISDLEHGVYWVKRVK